jgi:hypothetical protein
MFTFVALQITRARSVQNEILDYVTNIDRFRVDAPVQ